MRYRCLTAVFLAASAAAVQAAPARSGGVQLYKDTISPPATIQQPKLTVTAKPQLTTFSPTACVDKGGRLTVNGQNLGSAAGRGVALGGNGVHVDLPVVSWTATRIVATVPDDSRLVAGKSYYVGVERADHGEWLSNLANGVKICTPSAPGGGPITGDKLQAPPATSPVTTKIPANLPPPGGAPQERSAPVASEPEPDPEPASSAGSGSGTAGYTAAPAPSAAGWDYDYWSEGDWDEGDYWYEEYQEPAPAPQGVQPDRGGSLMGRSVPPAPQMPRSAAGRDADNHEPSQVVVITASMAESMELGRQLMQQGVRIKTRQPLANLGMVLNVLRLPAGMDVHQAVDTLRSGYPGLWVDTNQRFGLLGDERKRSAQQLFGWPGEAPGCAAELRLGMIDTAVDTGHPALAGRAVETKSFLRRGQADAVHGTAVAALLVGNPGGEFAGLLPAAALYAAEVFRVRDDRTETTAEWLLRGLDWLLGKQVDVVNLSLGGPRNLVVELAVGRTLERGTAVVAAAGNGGSDAAPVYPAAQEGVIAVTAVDARRRAYRNASRGEYIDFAAPGVDVWAADGANGGGVYRSGTSYAAPFVSALAATWRGLHAGTALVEPIRQAAVDLGEPGRDPVYGWGLAQWKAGCE